MPAGYTMNAQPEAITPGSEGGSKDCRSSDTCTNWSSAQISCSSCFLGARARTSPESRFCALGAYGINCALAVRGPRQQLLR
eukprot:886199-Heterocapsa_arctica.AAC.1